MAESAPIQISTAWPRLENPIVGAPLITKALAGICFCIALLNQITPSGWIDTIFGLIPGQYVTWVFALLKYRIVALTPPTPELFIIHGTYSHQALVNVFFVLFAVRYLEQFWGTIELAKFLFFTSSLSSVCALFTYLVLYFITYEESVLFPSSPYGGLGGFIAACTIALKQLLPDYEIKVFGVVGVRGKYVAWLYLGFNVIASLVGLPATSLPFTLFGFVFGWIYLRYLQKRDGVKGDASEQFAVASFFPEFMQPPVKAISNVCYALCCFCCPKPTNQQPRHLDHTSFVSVSMPSVFDQPKDAERRRQLGLKALDARLASIKASPATKVASQTFGTNSIADSTPSQQTATLDSTPTAVINSEESASVGDNNV